MCLTAPKPLVGGVRGFQGQRVWLEREAATGLAEGGARSSHLKHSRAGGLEGFFYLFQDVCYSGLQL